MRYRVVFLCTGISARSALIRAPLCAWAGQQSELFNADSLLAGAVNFHGITRHQEETVTHG